MLKPAIMSAIAAVAVSFWVTSHHVMVAGARLAAGVRVAAGVGA